MESESKFEVKFVYQSQHLELRDWITLFTLCLAPLIAHLYAGAPKVIHLQKNMPKWHDTIILYNPISIIWRYFAIAERALYSKLTLKELAALNVIYWTNDGWEASESKLQLGATKCIKPPPPFYDRLLSTDALKTVIVTFQGIGGVGIALPGKLAGNTTTLGNIFLPLAFIGLLRLPAAYWLTDDYYIIDPFERAVGAGVHQALLNDPSDIALQPGKPSPMTNNTSLQDSVDVAMPSYRPRLRALLVRLIYVLFLIFAFGVCLFGLIRPITSAFTISLTYCLLVWFYIFLLVSIICVICPYMSQRKPQPFCIPCANATWYKVHTCILVVLALVVVIVASLETHKTILGNWSSELQPSGNWTCDFAGQDVQSSSSCMLWSDNTWNNC